MDSLILPITAVALESQGRSVPVAKLGSSITLKGKHVALYKPHQLTRQDLVGTTDVNQLNKFHILYCSTVLKIIANGKLHEYWIKEDSNKSFKVFWEIEGESNHYNRDLSVCKNCLYQRSLNNRITASREEIASIVERFDLKLYLDYENGKKIRKTNTNNRANELHKFALEGNKQVTRKSTDSISELYTFVDSLRVADNQKVKRNRPQVPRIYAKPTTKYTEINKSKTFCEPLPNPEFKKRSKKNKAIFLISLLFFVFGIGVVNYLSINSKAYILIENNTNSLTLLDSIIKKYKSTTKLTTTNSSVDEAELNILRDDTQLNYEETKQLNPHYLNRESIKRLLNKSLNNSIENQKDNVVDPKIPNNVVSDLIVVDRTKNTEPKAKLNVRDNLIRNRYYRAVQNHIFKNWIRPESISEEGNCKIEIIQLLDGQITKSEVLSCSLDSSLLNQSFIEALWSSSPLPLPPRPELYSKNIILTLNFTEQVKIIKNPLYNQSVPNK